LNSTPLVPRNTRVGLALGGGGARGIAHIGLLSILHQQVRIDCLSGTSAGAIMAAMYAARPDPAWMIDHFRAYLDSREYKNLGIERLARQHMDSENNNAFTRRLKKHVAANMSLIKQYVVDRSRFSEALRFLLPVDHFDALSLPLTVCATDLSSGKLITYEQGDLITALANSASIPGVLEAEITADGGVLSDGGVIEPMPVSVLKSRTDFVIASEISLKRLPPLEATSIYRLMMRSEQLSKMALAQLQAQAADFIFEPDVMSLHWSRFDEMERLLAAGIVAGEQGLPCLQQSLRRHGSWRQRLRRWMIERLQVNSAVAD